MCLHSNFLSIEKDYLSAENYVLTDKKNREAEN